MLRVSPKNWSVRTAAAALFVCLSAGLADHAHAGLLNLNSTHPDATSTFITVNYSGGHFTAQGTPVAFDIDGLAPLDYSISGPSSFNIDMTVNQATGALVSGTLSITGKIAALSANGSLLTGNLTAFGFQDSPGGDIFEFKFDATGGALASYFGTTGGVILDAAGSNFHGAFNSSFTNDPDQLGFAVGVADVFPVIPDTNNVPEASSISLLLVCGGTSLALARLRRKASA